MFEFDDVLSEVGEFGRYQALKLVVVILGALPSAWHTLSIIFVGGKQDYWCKIPELENFTFAEQKAIGIPSETNSAGDVSYSKCTRYALNFSEITNYQLRHWNESDIVGNSTEVIGCSSWTFDQSQVISTISSQFGLVCDKSWLVAMTQTVYMCGWFLGCMVLGWVSDRFGRRLAYYLCFTIVFVIGFVQAFIPNIYLYFFTKLILGAGSGSIFATGLVLVMEVTGIKHRVWVSVLYNFSYCLALFVLPMIAWFVRDVYILQIILGALPAVVFPTFYFIDESPRWLIQKHRFDRAILLLARIAKTNGKVLHDREQLATAIKQATTEVERAQHLAGKSGKQPGLADIMKIPNLRKISLINYLQWFTTGASYYAILLMPTDLGTDAYVSTILGGSAALVAYSIVIPVITKLGRRVAMGSCLVILGTLLCVSSVVMNFEGLSVLLVIFIYICRGCTTGAFCTVYLFTAELFPTVVRNISVGMGSSAARIGSLLAPQIAYLVVVWRPLPVLLLGVLSLVTGVLNYLLPETLNVNLPETLEDGAVFGRRGSRFDATMNRKEMELKFTSSKTVVLTP